MANYMDDLLRYLHEHWGLEPEAVGFVKEELIKSFKNGLMRGRELERQHKADTPRSETEC